MNKLEKRKEMMAIRNKVISNKEKDEIIFQKIINLEEYRDCQSIFIYVSYLSEVNTIKIINKALDDKKYVLVPKTNKETKEMDAILIRSIDELEIGNYGILEPVDGFRANFEDIELVIIPGVAFDDKGNRLGYGGGYYDRFLSKINSNTQKIAISYEEQITNLEEFVEEHDAKYDVLVTNNRIIDNRKK